MIMMMIKNAMMTSVVSFGIDISAAPVP